MKSIDGPGAAKVYEAAGDMLKKVNFSHNKITVLPAAMFESCPKIESLILSENSLSRLVEGLGRLQKLT